MPIDWNDWARQNAEQNVHAWANEALNRQRYWSFKVSHLKPLDIDNAMEILRPYGAMLGTDGAIYVPHENGEAAKSALRREGWSV